MRYLLGTVGLFLLLGGCSAAVAPSSPAPVPPAMDAAADGAEPIAKVTPEDSSQLITVMMYRLRMPAGSVSGNAAFWKHVDEDAVGVGTYDLLYENGLRVGRAKVADWPAFKAVLDKDTTVLAARTIFRAHSAIGDALIDMSEQLPEETLFVFDAHGLAARSFDACQNKLSFAFEWEPSLSGVVRITICPVVMALQAEESSGDAYLRRENLYDLHLRADIAPGEFLVVGPSPAADDPNRVGARFLHRDGPNQKWEEVLILVGEAMRLDHVKSPRPATTRPGAVNVSAAH